MNIKVEYDVDEFFKNDCSVVEAVQETLNEIYSKNQEISKSFEIVIKGYKPAKRKK